MDISKTAWINPWISSDKSDRKRNIGKFFGDTLLQAHLRPPLQDSVNLKQNLVLFQIKFFGRNMKESVLGRYFIKVTACSSFMQLRVSRINRIH